MHDLSMFEGLTLRAGPRMATLHPGLQALILRLGIEAGTVLVDVGQVTVTEYQGLRPVSLEGPQQGEQRPLLGGCACVGSYSVLVESALVAHADGVGVISLGVGALQVLVARLVGVAAARDVVVVAGISEAFEVVGYQRGHGVRLVAARRRAVYHNHVYSSHIISH